MQKFAYKAKDVQGKTIKGIVEAKDEKLAAKILREKSLLVIGLNPKNPDFFAQISSNLGGKVNESDKVTFTRQLAIMITAGLPLTDSLVILETQSRPSMAKIVGELLREVESGGSLSSALRKHPLIFDEVYISLVEAGESAGVLNEVLTRLADNLEKQREFKGKIKGAMVYPAIVIIGMVGVAAIMILFVLPKLAGLFEELNADLPITTKILLQGSKFASSFWWLLVIIVVGAAIGLKTMLKNPRFRKAYDKYLLKLPIVGKLQQDIILTEFSRTLGMLVGAGILIVEALEVVKNSAGNLVYEEGIKSAILDVEKGLPLATALARTEVFPPILTQMATVGEETGKLDEVLLKVSNYFEIEADMAVKGLTTAIEPLIMIVLGIGIGFLIISVIMPIFSLTSKL